MEQHIGTSSGMHSISSNGSSASTSLSPVSGSAGDPLFLHKPPSTVKLFVGQLPKTMHEDQLREFFEQFGSVIEVSVIREKTTGTHRGCAFVTFSSRSEAENCIQSLHNVKALPPMNNPLQVKYAEGELERLEHKLFIGMVPKCVNEDQLRKVFEPYGSVVELSVLRGSDGVSKGCAFLKYEERQEAINAINACHGQVFMQGGTQALVVKFADPPKKKEVATKQQNQQQDSLLALKNQQIQLLLQQMATIYNPFPQQYGATGLGMSLPTSSVSPTSPVYGTATSLSQTEAPALQLSQQLTNQLVSQLAAASTFPYPGMSTPAYSSSPTMGKSSSASGQSEGPPGANLFIYHLPQHYGDQDLATSFSPFGNVLSAKVFIDKTTGQSKCFGFVSFDAAQSAQLAIQHMNGFQIGQKRLKVELKRMRGQPY